MPSSGQTERGRRGGLGERRRLKVISKNLLHFEKDGWSDAEGG